MHRLLLIILFIHSGMQSHSQNILEAIELQQENAERKYSEGESMSNDTIIDLVNGYYAEFYKEDELIYDPYREATIYKNSDGSKTLAISISYWDFVCMVYYSEFYEISTSGKEIEPKLDSDLIPTLQPRDFIKNNDLITLFEKYLPELQGNYLNKDATIDIFLNEVYDIVYRLPRHGTTIIAKLKLCDYIPTNEIEIAPEDWEKMESDVKEIHLKYNPKTKQFEIKK